MCLRRPRLDGTSLLTAPLTNRSGRKIDDLGNGPHDKHRGGSPEARCSGSPKTKLRSVAKSTYRRTQAPTEPCGKIAGRAASPAGLHLPPCCTRTRLPMESNGVSRYAGALGRMPRERLSSERVSGNPRDPRERLAPNKITWERGPETADLARTGSNEFRTNSSDVEQIAPHRSDAYRVLAKHIPHVCLTNQH